MAEACRIVAIGEVLWDVFDDSERLGGAPLNFSIHASRLGHPVLLVSGIGNDQRGHSALAAVRQAGLDARFIHTFPALPTGVARVFLDPDGQTSFRIERPAAYDAADLSMTEYSEIAAWKPQWLYYGTLFAYQEHPPLRPGTVASRLPHASRFYDVNLRQGCYSPEIVRELLALADVVKLNEAEMSSIAAIAGFPASGIESFCAQGAARFGWDAVAVSLGANGCAVWRGGEYAEAPGYKVRVSDTVGAGDAFSAAVLHGLCLRWRAGAVADFANQLGSLIASRPGGMPHWTMDELRIPDRPFGPALPSIDAQRSRGPVPEPPAPRVP
jgi:fructokinase